MNVVEGSSFHDKLISIQNKILSSAEISYEDKNRSI